MADIGWERADPGQGRTVMGCSAARGLVWVRDGLM